MNMYKYANILYANKNHSLPDLEFQTQILKGLREDYGLENFSPCEIPSSFTKEYALFLAMGVDYDKIPYLKEFKIIENFHIKIDEEVRNNSA